MTKHRSGPTLTDVAKAAGVSTATVSRCLNNPDQVVEATRIRVLKTVEALGYTPNFAARVMAANRSFTIGAIIPTMDNAIFARGLQAFQDQLSERGYTLLVSSSAYDPDVEFQQIKALVSRGADGLLLIGHDRDEQVYDYLQTHNVPTLVAWSYLESARLPSVGFSNREAMRNLTQHVLDAGHRRIAMISAMPQGNDRAAFRIKGAKDALQANGLSADDVQIIHTTYDIERGADAFRQVMSSRNRPTAVLCGNDVLAAGAIRQAARMGLDVPRDVSITGFDDIELAEIVDPALTTVHVPHKQMGHLAAVELVSMVEGASNGQSNCIETRVVHRQSLAAPPS